MTSDETIKILKMIPLIVFPRQPEAIKMAIVALKSNWTVEKRREQAEWLKQMCCPTKFSFNFVNLERNINEAFGLNEPTLEEKVAEVFKKWDNTLTDEENLSGHYKRAIEVCREYFRTHKEELEI